MQPIIKKDHVRLEASAEGRTRPRERGHAKAARLVEIDGAVRAIELRCSCGEVTVMELTYDEPETEKEPDT